MPLLTTSDKSLYFKQQHIRHYYHAASRKVEGSIPHQVIGFFNSPDPSSRTMALGLTQPLTEMSTRKADNLTAICEPIVSQAYVPPRFATGIALLYIIM
jgi:hypothetical protein